MEPLRPCDDGPNGAQTGAFRAPSTSEADRRTKKPPRRAALRRGASRRVRRALLISAAAQHLLRQLVGLRDHRRAGLLQDLRARQVAVSAAKSASMIRPRAADLVLARDLQVRDRRRRSGSSRHRRWRGWSLIVSSAVSSAITCAVDGDRRRSIRSPATVVITRRWSCRSSSVVVAVVGADLEGLRAGAGAEDRRCR